MAKPAQSVALSVVIPVYRGAPNIRELAGRLTAVLQARCSKFEILFVNDASPDASWETICEISSDQENVRGINLMRNFGQHAALLAGIRTARYPLIVTMDDDLQHPPEEIPKLLARLIEGVDVVYGVPSKRNHEAWRNLGSLFVRVAVAAVSTNEAAKQATAFRLFRASLKNAFDESRMGVIHLDALLNWGTTRFTSVTVEHDLRKSGTSNYGFLKLLNLSATMLTSYTTLPLRLASLLGMMSTIFGFFVLLYVIGRYLIEGTSVAGFPFLASTIALFSGIQLFGLGIIGEYLGKVYLQSMNRPSYIIAETVGMEEPSAKAA